MCYDNTENRPLCYDEKIIGDKSYYVVQAVPVTKAKTLYIVGAFIGKTGYKNGTQQLINANRQNSISPNATPESGSAEVPTSIVSENEEESNNTNEKSQ